MSGIRHDETVDAAGRAGATQRLRTAALIATLSLATDLGMGQPLEHGLRATMIAVRLADRLGLNGHARRAVYYVCQLRYAGCTAESHLDAALFGDEIAARADMLPALFGSRAEVLVAAARSVYADEPLRWRAAALARASIYLKRTFREHGDA
jgi:hypothetical protein